MKVHNLLVTGSLTSGGENITAISSSVSSTVTSLSSSVSTSIGSLSSSMVSSMNSLSSSMGSIMATTGSNLFKGDQTISGSIIPAVNSSYDLGSPTNEFRHLYLSSASLYIDGTKVLGSTTQELQITTDAGQSFKILEAGSDTITLQAADGNITLATSAGGDVILDPTTGIIALKGTTTLYAGNKILSSDGNAIQIGNSVTMTGSLIVTGFIETQELRTTYISSSILYRSGSTKFGDELTDTHSFTGSLSVSGSISVPGSNLVSGSAQILSGTGIWSGSAQLPSGVISGSAQLPSGVVSGSAQVDVMSTTNIARLATTGSNTFTSNQIVTGSISSTGNIAAGTTFSWNGGIGALSYGTGVVTLETNTANAIQLKTNGTTAITISTGQTVNFANSITAGTSISAGTFLGATRAGANGVGEGPYMVIAQPSQSKQWLFQLNGSAGLDYWHYNGSAWSVPLTLSTSGNIGINITNPTQKLEIGNGNLRLTEIGASSFDISYSGGKVQFGTDSAGTQGFYFRTYSGSYADRFIIKASGEVNVAGSILPTSDASYNLGSTSLRWNNLYTTDLHLSNEGKQNVVDGTWGDWTLQEGEHDIFMLNNRSGEKFKIKLEKIIE